eukprot:TRINITY_DN2392_c0_g1_i1.p1 TRINITY_DN2392_c0_g1~~TRINITY_DN2392_c0_g1_i1.p1  ORF type:complete len:600 (+),score=141.35 TRINITY_DN2392_c0_g1_i1:463-2262(+)
MAQEGVERGALSSKQKGAGPGRKGSTRGGKRHRGGDDDEAALIEQEQQQARELQLLLFGTGDASDEAAALVGNEVPEGGEALRLQELLSGAEPSHSAKKKKATRRVIQEAVQLEDAVLLGELEQEEGQGVVEVHEEDNLGKSSRVGPRAAVWQDEDDATQLVNLAAVNRLRKLRTKEEEALVSGDEYVRRLRQQHSKLHPGGSTAWARLPKRRGESKQPARFEDEDDPGQWAEADGEGDEPRLREGGEDEDEDDERILREGGLVRKSSRGGLLSEGRLDTTRLHDANQADPCRAVVQSVHFHPNAQLLVTASYDRTLRFFHIDGKENAKVQSIFLSDMPIKKALFSHDGARVIAGGRRKWFYVFDMAGGQVERVSSIGGGEEERSMENFELSPDNRLIAFLGNAGRIALVSQQTRQLVANLKMNGSVRAAAFGAGGNELVTSGGDGQIYHWDLRTRRCFHKGTDEGCLNSTSLAVSGSGGGGLIAAASDTGVVNLYQRQAFLGSGAARPLKSFLNLTTEVDTLKFNPDSQILAIASRMKKDSLRFIHVPSRTVFSNWPTARSPLNLVHCLDWSPGGGYCAIGNAKGRVLLYRIHHYERP